MPPVMLLTSIVINYTFTNMAENNTSETLTTLNQKCHKEDFPGHIPWKIYLSRFLAAWGYRSWAFGAGIFMVELAPENLRLVSIYGLVLCTSVIVFGATIGNWIDRNERLKAASLFIALQKTITCLTCVILGLYFSKVGTDHWPTWIPELVSIVTIFLAALAQLASVGIEIVVEKDWIVVIAM